LRFLTGFRQWEKVVHVGAEEYSREGEFIS